MSSGRKIAVLFIVAVLAGCATPFRPPVIVAGSAPFPGIAGLVEPLRREQLDVLMVHGMCSHTRGDASQAIDKLVAALDKNSLSEVARDASLQREVDGIQIETRSIEIGLASIRFTALVWSGLTAALKAQLAYDSTASPRDCAKPGECKPSRAYFNGVLKDGLLNDCLADALAYQGESRHFIRRKMVAAITQAVGDSEASARAASRAPGSFVLVSDSLGSKIAFDALEAMLGDGSAATKAAGDSAFDRLALVFMRANQLPILGLADQEVDVRAASATTQPAAQDSLQRLLSRKANSPPARAAIAADPAFRLALVAFTDPNDLLSYRLLPSRYAIKGIDVADVLVSNAPSYLGLLEIPTVAHTGYVANPDVNRFIVCGSSGSVRCR